MSLFAAIRHFSYYIFVLSIIVPESHHNMGQGNKFSDKQ